MEEKRPILNDYKLEEGGYSANQEVHTTLMATEKLFFALFWFQLSFLKMKMFL